MDPVDSVVAVFADHAVADGAVRKLAAGGFELKNLSIVGKGYHTEENVVGFYNVGDRVKLWGSRGAVWGALWGLFFGGLFVTLPVTGPVIVLGYLATMALSVVESALVVSGLSALAAALASIGIPKNSVVLYEAAVKADGFLVMARGSAEQIAKAKSILADAGPTRVDIHTGVAVPASNAPLAPAAD
jgi:hypothetical protein